MLKNSIGEIIFQKEIRMSTVDMQILVGYKLPTMEIVFINGE